VTCGITFTFGGLRINTDAGVLNTDYQPIRGLYAAGELVGGIFYFNYPGGSGLISGAVFGKIAHLGGTRLGRLKRHGAPPQTSSRRATCARRVAARESPPRRWWRLPSR